jgi:tetratricopeptide (TPR) repeat protein
MANELQDYYTHEAARDMDYRKFMEEQTRSIDVSIQESSARIKESIDMQTLATVASHAVLDQTLQHGFIGVNNTLVDGFSGVSNQLGYMAAAFSNGLSRISDNINLMSNEICNKLDAMHDIANNPLLTQARELSRRAVANYRKGFFEEALEDINAAIEKEKTDYFSWFLKGSLYAYGVGEFSNVIDLKQAINAFIQAAKYNSPYIKESQDARGFEAEIYFYLGKAQHSYANELLRTGNTANAGEMISKALESFEKSVQYSDKMLESMLNVARCKVLLNKKEAAIDDLEKLVLLDRKYCIKVLADDDFSSTLKGFATLIEKLRHNLFVGGAERNYKKAVDLQNTLGTYGIYENKIPSGFSEELPYLDLLGYNDKFKRIIPQIEREIQEARERKEWAEREERERKEWAEREERERKEKAKREKRERKEKAEREERERKEKAKEWWTQFWWDGLLILSFMGFIASAYMGGVNIQNPANDGVYIALGLVSLIGVALGFHHNGSDGIATGCSCMGGLILLFFVMFLVCKI